MLREIPRTLVPFVACALVAGADASVASAAPSSAKVVLLGSSSVNDAFGDIIADSLQKDGFSVSRYGYPSAGLSRPDFHDMHAEAQSMPIAPDTAAVLLYLGGNDAQPLWLTPKERDGNDAWIKWNDKRWSEIYERRARSLIDTVCARGARKVLVLVPADVTHHKMQRKLDRIRSLQAKAASASKCGHAITTTGDEGAFDVSKKPLRGPKGVHMTHAGASRVWGRVEKRVRELLGAQKQG